MENKKYTIDDYIKENELNKKTFIQKNEGKILGFPYLLLILISFIFIYYASPKPFSIKLIFEIFFTSVVVASFFIFAIYLWLAFINLFLEKKYTIPINDELRYKYLENYEKYLSDMKENEHLKLKLEKAKMGEL